MCSSTLIWSANHMWVAICMEMSAICNPTGMAIPFINTFSWKKKWLPFCRWQLPIHLLDRKWLYFERYVTLVLLQRMYYSFTLSHHQRDFIYEVSLPYPRGTVCRSCGYKSGICLTANGTIKCGFYLNLKIYCKQAFLSLSLTTVLGIVRLVMKETAQ